MHIQAELATKRKNWLYAAAVLSALAGFIHILVTPDHFEEWIGYGLFFLVASTAQFMFALLLLAHGSNRDLLLAGIVGNGLIIALWLVTRTVGIPFFGPEAGEVEPVGVIDTVSKLVEGALIVCLVELIRTAATRVAGGKNP